MAIQTQIIKIDLGQLERDKIGRIAEILRKGKIIAYPTETFYGLGANCYREEAIQRIYRLKKRDYAKPLSIVISDRSMMEELAIDVPPVFRALAREFWPGPLTVILKASSQLPRQLLSSEGSVGVRMPALSWLRALIEMAGFPITATSANLTGQKEISEPDEVIKTFGGKVDLIADGGKTPGILPSTVIDLTSEKPQIVREGAVPVSKLRRFLEISSENQR